jgi:hypothetical protein
MVRLRWGRAQWVAGLVRPRLLEQRLLVSDLAALPQEEVLAVLAAPAAVDVAGAALAKVEGDEEAVAKAVAVNAAAAEDQAPAEQVEVDSAAVVVVVKEEAGSEVAAVAAAVLVEEVRDAPEAKEVLSDF